MRPTIYRRYHEVAGGGGFYCWCDSDGKVLCSEDSFVYTNDNQWFISKDEVTLGILRRAYGSVQVSFVRDSQTFVMTYNGYEFEVREGMAIGFSVQNYE